MKSVSVIGLGYIGLPTSALLAENGIKVFGVDINSTVVNTINNGNVHIVEPDLDMAVKNAVDNGMLVASTEPKESDVYIIVVPTPFKANLEPDISYIKKATDTIIPFLKENDLYIIESTSPVGTTEKMQSLIYSKRPELKDKISIAYCPERVLPGNIIYELINNDRIIGGINDNSNHIATKFYKKFVKGGLYTTNARTAEMCKLVENSSRDVQIAYANELSIICDKAGINVWELIDLANKHPRVNILNPGCGVGGHCIAVDPYFITNQFPKESKMIGTARQINNFKPEWCLKKINTKILELEDLGLKNPKIGVFGLAFKPNIDDLRESPALKIALDIFHKRYSKNVYFFEPNIDSHDILSISKIEEDFIKTLDLAVILVNHKEFQNISFDKGSCIINFTQLNK